MAELKARAGTLPKNSQRVVLMHQELHSNEMRGEKKTDLFCRLDAAEVASLKWKLTLSSSVKRKQKQKRDYAAGWIKAQNAINLVFFSCTFKLQNESNIAELNPSCYLLRKAKFYNEFFTSEFVVCAQQV